MSMESVIKPAGAGTTRYGWKDAAGAPAALLHGSGRVVPGAHFQAAHFVSALVVYAWAPGIVATTL